MHHLVQVTLSSVEQLERLMDAVLKVPDVISVVRGNVAEMVRVRPLMGGEFPE